MPAGRPAGALLGGVVTGQSFHPPSLPPSLRLSSLLLFHSADCALAGDGAVTSRWELLASLSLSLSLFSPLLPPVQRSPSLPPPFLRSRSLMMTKPPERRSGGANAVQDECDKRAVKIMSERGRERARPGGRGGVCAECVRVSGDPTACPMHVTISPVSISLPSCLSNVLLWNELRKRLIFVCLRPTGNLFIQPYHTNFLLPPILIGILDWCALAADWREIYCFLLWTKCEHLRLWRWRVGREGWR